MTQKEAIIKALEELGGRAWLRYFYPRVIQLAKFKPDSDKKATIRTTLQRHPECFRHSPGKPDGWWELVSFQEEIASRDQRIKELEEENARLMSINTEDNFVKRLVRETKNLYKHEKDKIEVIRQILYKVGRSDAEEELDAWIEGREYKSSINVQGNYVAKQTIENQVNGVAKGATGISIHKEEKE